MRYGLNTEVVRVKDEEIESFVRTLLAPVFHNSMRCVDLGIMCARCEGDYVFDRCTSDGTTDCVGNEMAYQKHVVDTLVSVIRGNK